MRKVPFLALLVLIANLTACGGGTVPTAASSSGGGVGNSTEGKTIYNQVATPPCRSCHSIEAGVTLVGPSLANIGAMAGTIESGMGPEEYLRQSIVDPNAYIAPGFSGNIMPATYGTQLTEQQISDLVAYLMMLK